ncbi:ATP-binding protein [Hyphomonas sp. BRH_c22]|uniref:ATP-binding protein n=1 Tax=Hyphomonas sp. BRH_c22 TaxID=1629710 RepID=UPI000A5D2496|nr:ATP-binding protein [Hyphomonas sp. BRH_c22]
MTHTAPHSGVPVGPHGRAGVADLVRRPGIAHILLTLAACLIITGAAQLTRGTGDIAAIWPVNATLLAVMLKWPRAQWPSLFGCLFLGSLLANLIMGDPWLRCVILSAANCVEVLIVALMLCRKSRPDIIRKSGIMKLFAATLVACSVSTPIALAGLAVTGAALAGQAPLLWFFSHMLGLLLFAPLLWALMAKRESSGVKAGWKSFLEALLVVVVTTGVFAQSIYPLLFLVPPVLVPLTFRHGARGAAVALLAVTVISIGFTYAGRGPTVLADGGFVLHMLVLQAFLAANFYVALSLGASVAERRRLTLRARYANRRFLKRMAREKEFLAQAELAEAISQVGHWTLRSDIGAVFWSPEVYRIHGVTPETFNPTLGDALDFYCEDDRERVSNLIKERLETGEDWDTEATIIRRSDGSRRRVRSIAKCNLGPSGKVENIFGVFKDITQEHELYEALATQEEQYRLLAEHSTDIVLKFGADGIISYASPSASIITPPEKAVGMRPVDFVVPEDREFAIAVTRALFTGEDIDPSVAREYRVRLKDGSVIWLEGRPQVIRDKLGKPVEVVSSYRDVSERHEREKALAEARLLAEAAAVARSEFLSNMSHEIRTPLNGVMGFADMLKTTPLSDDQAAYVQRIVSASRSLLGIVNDVLDFSKIDAGRMDVEMRPFDLRAVIDEVVSLVSAARPNPRVRISYQVAEDVAALVVGDETRVRQILTNIVGNAAKFTEAGHVRLDARLKSGRLCVIVADTGPGIPADKLDHVFTGFSQADSSITRRFGGTGLGLSISRSLAKLMDGDLKLISAPGEGTNAILTLPYFPERRSETADASGMVPDRRVPAGSRIMVVDDVEMNRALVEAGLAASGHHVTSFASAAGAIQALVEGAMFDVILMDIQMPDMDGMTATRCIRQMTGAASRIPIVALTANAMASQAEECRAAGMDAHFPKPIDMKALNDLIAQLLHEKGQEDALRSAKADAAIARLKDECRQDIMDLPGKLGALLRIADPDMRAKAIAALAHSVAGTAGNFGFSAVSDAAFRLEAVTKEIIAGAPVKASLEEAVGYFIRIAEQQAA